MLEAYFDASGVSDPARVLSVAGYLFDEAKCKTLNARWTELLEPFFYALPKNKRFFRMADFKERRIEPYCKMNDAERLSLHRELIDAASAAEPVVAMASVKRKDFENSTDQQKRILVNPYLACSVWCMNSLAAHVSKALPGSKIAYFLEAGDPGQGDLLMFLDRVAGNAKMSERFRYESHSAVQKHANHALGVADILAWEYRTAIEQDILDQKLTDPRVFFNLMLKKPIDAIYLHPTNLSIHAMVQHFIKVQLDVSQ